MTEYDCIKFFVYYNELNFVNKCAGTRDKYVYRFILSKSINKTNL